MNKMIHLVSHLIKEMDKMNKMIHFITPFIKKIDKMNKMNKDIFFVTPF